jgi:hypothetical protein
MRPWLNDAASLYMTALLVALDLENWRPFLRRVLSTLYRKPNVQKGTQRATGILIRQEIGIMTMRSSRVTHFRRPGHAVISPTGGNAAPSENPKTSRVE